MDLNISTWNVNQLMSDSLINSFHEALNSSSADFPEDVTVTRASKAAVGNRMENNNLRFLCS